MPYKPATVNVNAANPSVNPDLIHVKKADSDQGVIWTIPNKTHTFTNVTFDSNADNFDNIVIGENNAGQSTMQVDDSIANLGDIKYNLFYIKNTEPNTILEIDPRIRNQ